VNSPIILVLPGGGYQNHADHEGEPVAEWLRGLGWRARVVRYPVRTRHPGPLDYMRAEIKAERDAGATAVGLIGFSAGGHLAGQVAATGGADFAILGYPVVSMELGTHAGSRENLLGRHPAPWTRRALSVDRLITPQSPPFFVWHTAEDDSVPVQHAYLLGQALAAHGVPHELHVFPDGPHGIGFGEGLPAAEWRALCATWLGRLGL
jgi:acetyl esterase/lipase